MFHCLTNGILCSPSGQYIPRGYKVAFSAVLIQKQSFHRFKLESVYFIFVRHFYGKTNRRFLNAKAPRLDGAFSG